MSKFPFKPHHGFLTSLDFFVCLFRLNILLTVFASPLRGLFSSIVFSTSYSQVKKKSRRRQKMHCSSRAFCSSCSQLFPQLEQFCDDVDLLVLKILELEK